MSEAELERRLEACNDAGIRSERIIRKDGDSLLAMFGIDPGEDGRERA